jgi:ABC-type proline/glycine betaine transport system permease subunit
MNPYKQPPWLLFQHTDCVDFGVPLGIFAARKTADVIIRPILDLMQTMPAFVYLIPAIFF